MLFFENVLLAFSSLKVNKMRSLLTMLGIIIGIGSVICIDTLGNSLTAAVVNMMGSTGGNSIYLGVQQKSTQTETSESGAQFRGPNRQRTPGNDDLLTDEMFDYIKEQMPDEIEAITVNISLGNGTVTKGTNYANVSVAGVNKEFFEHGQKPEMISGSNFDNSAYDDGRAVCLVSDYFCNNLYDGDTEKALGNTIDVVVGNKFYTFTIMGVYKYNASAMGGMMSMFQSSEYDMGTDLYVPINNIKKKNHTSGYQMATVIIDGSSTTDIDAVTDKLTQLLDRYYHNNKYFKPSASNVGFIFEEITKTMNSIKLVFSAIAAISLLVGGIGVMNIMLVSISERTREIGTRKALGASNGSIRTQFIVEAVVLCLVGGTIGIILGITGGAIGVKIVASVSNSNVTASPAISSIIIAVLFSFFIGVFFGYYPANKAAKMNPIDALRYE